MLVNQFGAKIPAAGGAPFDITTLPGVLWALRWDLGVYSDAGGIVPTTDGDSVHIWENQAGQGDTGYLNQGTSTSRGVYKDAGYIDFLGSAARGMVVVDGSTMYYGNDCTIILECTVNSPGSFAYTTTMNDGAAAPILFRSTGNVDVYYSGSANSAGAFTTGETFDFTMHSMVLKRTGTTTVVSYDGGAFSSDLGITEPSFINLFLSQFVALGGSSSAQNRWKGMVVSTQNLSDAEIANAKSWLRA